MRRDLRHGQALRLARRLWDGWKRVAKTIGIFQARILLMVFYSVIFGPFALTVRWGSDPLAVRALSGRGWLRRTPEPGTPLDVRGQY